MARSVLTECSPVEGTRSVGHPAVRVVGVPRVGVTAPRVGVTAGPEGGSPGCGAQQPILSVERGTVIQGLDVCEDPLGQGGVAEGALALGLAHHVIEAPGADRPVGQKLGGPRARAGALGGGGLLVPPRRLGEGLLQQPWDDPRGPGAMGTKAWNAEAGAAANAEAEHWKGRAAGVGGGSRSVPASGLVKLRGEQWGIQPFVPLF